MPLQYIQSIVSIIIFFLSQIDYFLKVIFNIQLSEIEMKNTNLLLSSSSKINILIIFGDAE